MPDAASKDKPTALYIVRLLSGLLWLVLAVQTLEIGYRLYLFGADCHFQRNENHADSVSDIWMTLGSVLLASMVLWFMATFYRCGRYVLPLVVATISLLGIFYIMRTSGALVTYDEFVERR